MDTDSSAVCIREGEGGKQERREQGREGESVIEMGKITVPVDDFRAFSHFNTRLFVLASSLPPSLLPSSFFT